MHPIAPIAISATLAITVIAQHRQNTTLTRKHTALRLTRERERIQHLIDTELPEPVRRKKHLSLHHGGASTTPAPTAAPTSPPTASAPRAADQHS
jgi:hypothetical protein